MPAGLVRGEAQAAAPGVAPGPLEAAHDAAGRGPGAAGHPPPPAAAAAALALPLPVQHQPLVDVHVLEVPDGRPAVDVEPGLVLGVQVAEDLREAPAEGVVALGEVGQAPVAQLVGVVDLRFEKKIKGKYLTS